MSKRRTTTQRGYGNPHQRERARRLALWKPGDPCARCGQPIWYRWQWRNGQRVTAIHLGHTADRTGYTGLEHERCNEADGARRGNRQRGTVIAWRTARRW